MRTKKEIIARIHARQDKDIFGFEINDYLVALDFEDAKEFLKPEATEDQWEVAYPDDESVRKQAIEYMPFAWDKANNCRGLSVWLWLTHYTAWLWLLGDDELWPQLEEYELYGKPELRKICDYFGLDADQWDDGIRVNDDLGG